MDCVQNVCNTNITVYVGIPLREVIDKMLGWLDTGGYKLTQSQLT
jgi:hypothetical protein